jgi:putative transposase
LLGLRKEREADAKFFSVSPAAVKAKPPSAVQEIFRKSLTVIFASVGKKFLSALTAFFLDCIWLLWYNKRCRYSKKETAKGRLEMRLRKNNHSAFALYYHLVLVTKYRRKVIDKDVSVRLLEIFKAIGKKYDIEVIEFNSELDHAHILFSATLQSELAKFVNVYKSAGSKYIKLEFADRPAKEFNWKMGFCIVTAGDASLGAIKEYIKNQSVEE